MMRLLKSCVAAYAGLVLAASSALAADTGPGIRPGLWELTTTSELLKLVSQVDPQQIRQLQQLAQQYGIAIPRVDAGAAVAQVCITADMARRQVLPDLTMNQSGCHSSNARRNGATYSVDIACENNRVSGRGHSQATFQNAEQFSGSTSFQGDAQGVPLDQHAETTGRWLQAQCPG
jgi:hypothetical protein